MQLLHEYKTEIGFCASLFGILQMLAPVPTCYYFLKKKSVGDMSSAPYVSAFLSCSLWTLYGFLLDDPVVIQVNKIGTVLFFCYVASYFICCVQKTAVIGQMLIASCVILLTVIYIRFEPVYDVALSRVGMLVCFVTVLFFAAPFASLRHVLKVKSSESLPFLLILMSFIVSFLWSLYGILLDDFFVMAPNVIGCVLCTLQLILCCIYPRTPSSPKMLPL